VVTNTHKFPSILRSAAIMFVLAAGLRAQTTSTGFQYFYDDLGQLTKVVDSTGTVAEYIYDPVGNILQIKRSTVTPDALAVFNFTPQRGTPGQAVTIQGQAFDLTPANDILHFNGTATSVLAASPTTLTVVVPAAATSGPISVTVGGQTVASPNSFTVLAPPTITGMSCKSALFNKAVPNVQVTGTNLGDATFSFASISSFPGVSVTSSSTDPSGSSAILNLQAGSQAGTFALVATNLAGSSSVVASPGNRFTVVNPASKADTSGNGLPDVIKAEFCADPLDPNSFPNIPQGIAIQTVQDLQNIANDLAGNYHLANDIDASVTATWNGGQGFIPIGGPNSPFTGTLNGKGHIIAGLFINSGATNVGLFGNIDSGALVENINLVQANVTGTGGGQETGATGLLAGRLDGEVANCSVSGSVTGTSTGNFVGGLIGVNGGTVTNSSAVVAVSAPGFGSAGGGLVGINVGTVSNSNATGTITNSGQGGGMGGLVGENEPPGLIVNSQSSANANGNSTANASVVAVVGGLAGFNSATIKQSRATGAVSGLNASLVGGLVGANGAGGVIEQSFATGATENGQGGSGGGLVGLNLGAIQQSLGTGSVNNTSTGGNEGGLVGANELTGTIAQSYATGTASGHSLSGIGGLVGFNGDNSPQISQSFSTGAVVGPGANCVGGLVGCNPAGTTAVSSYWDVLTSRQSTSAAGIGETTAQLQSGTLPTGFDPTVWATQSGIYPYLICLGPTPLSVIVNSSQNPSAAGQSVTFTAIVSPVLPVPAGGPTGTVTFLDGGNIMGTGTLSGGVATFTSSTLGLGSHTVTVTYGGDGTFNSGNGTLNGNPQVVTQIPIPTPTITPPPPPIIPIQTVQDLQNMANNLAGNYHLVNDIDASVTATWNGGQGFLPVGSSNNPFTGMLNGNGHVITSLFINSSATNVGLFGSADPAALIQNVNLVQANITGTGGGLETGATGALVGHLDGEVTNCSVSGSITGTSTGNFVGGLVGLSDGTISNSSALVSVSAPGDGSAGGGLVGINVGTVTNSTATGTVTNPGQGGGMGGLVGENQPPGLILNSQASATVSGNTTLGGSVVAAVGGLAGFNSATISRSSATGGVSGLNQSFVGGLVGVNAAGGVIEQTFATGAVNDGVGGPGGAGGGLVGLNLGAVQQSVATGAVDNSGTGGDGGGLVGANELTGTIAQSYATGTVSGNAQSGIGGLVGTNADNSPQILQSYSTGVVVGPNAGCTGGLVGCDPAGTTAAFSYWDVQASRQTASAMGIGETTAQLQSGTLPEGFDPTVWAAQTGFYPNLIWLGSSPVTVVLTSSQNPSTPGTSVTFTATVAPILPSTNLPTGTVTFLDGGNAIGTGIVSGGKAAFTTSALTVGSHFITASYGGDGTFTGATGSLTGNPQVVNQTNSSTAYPFSPDFPDANSIFVLSGDSFSIFGSIGWQ